MESATERAQRIRRLEAQRASRRAEGVWPTPDEAGYGSVPVELAPGRGNLSLSSGHIPQIPTALQLLGSRTVSFTRLFQSQPWVAAAVMRMLTWSVRVPLRVYERTDDPHDRKVLGPKQHPVAKAIAAPWNRANTAQLVQAMLGPVMVHGNAVLRIEEGAGGAIRFDPKDWRFAAPIMPWRGSLEGFVFDMDTPEFKESVSIDEILHTSWWSPSGPMRESLGTSPLQQLGITLQIEDAAQRYQRSIFQNGARPPSAITASEEFLTLDRRERKELMDQLRSDVDHIYGGPENAGKPALLPPGLDWKPIGLTTVEAELVNQRKVAREEVCAVYLIPPPLMGILDKATYSNIQVQRDMTYTDCLGPPLVLIEQALNAQLIRELLHQDDDVFVEFDFSAVLRGDRIQEIEGLRNAVGSALMSPNEARGVLGFPKIEEDSMDEYYLPAVNNLAPITGDKAFPDQPTEPGQPQDVPPGGGPAEDDPAPPSPSPSSDHEAVPA